MPTDPARGRSRAKPLGRLAAKASRTPSTDIKIDLVRGVEGNCLSLDEGDGCGHRIAGPKPWGGGDVIQTFRIRATDTASLDALQAAIDRARGKAQE